MNIRPAIATDQAYVAATWVRNSRADNSLVDRLLDDARTRILIAEEHDRIIGWLAYCARPRVLEYCYVRAPRRRERIASRLLEAAGMHPPLACLYDPKWLVRGHHVIVEPKEFLSP